MKTFRAKQGPFETRLYFSAEEIDRLCCDALGDDFLPKTPRAVRIDRFIEKYFRCSIAYEQLPENVLGCSVFRKDGTVDVVVISSKLEDGKKTSERRVRSTLAHEGGHCLLHGQLFSSSTPERLFAGLQTNYTNIDFEGRRILCRAQDIQPGIGLKTYDGRWWEWQANRAIGSFLLPKSLVTCLIGPLLQESLVTRSPTLSATRRDKAEQLVAETFEVNPAVARIRLSEMFPPSTGQLEF